MHLMAIETAVTAPAIPAVPVRLDQRGGVGGDERRAESGLAPALVPGVILGIAYFLAMLAVAGFVGAGTQTMTGWRIIAATPGWGPMIAYQGAFVRLYVVPFQVFGYALLAYLLYSAALQATLMLVSLFSSHPCGTSHSTGAAVPSVSASAGSRQNADPQVNLSL